MGGRDSYEVWEGHAHTAVFKVCNQNRLLDSVGEGEGGMF